MAIIHSIGLALWLPFAGASSPLVTPSPPASAVSSGAEAPAPLTTTLPARPDAGEALRSGDDTAAAPTFAAGNCNPRVSSC